MNIPLVAVLTTAATTDIAARGVSPYLPWKLAPEIERSIERVMILADRPVLTRPIPAAAVIDALPAACEIDASVCEQVKRYVDRLMRPAAVTHASLAAAGESGAPTALPNRHGMRTDSGFEASMSAHWQPSDFLLVAGGFLSYEDETVAAGTMISAGNEYAQIDLGYRDHWLSPMTDSAYLIGAQARAMPSVTLSNSSPLTRLGFRYEIFVAEMSRQENIGFGDSVTAGNPRLAGFHVSVEPVAGWTIGVNRILQYGGGQRADSLGDLWDALVDPSGVDNTGTTGDFGNQAASITSRILIPTSRPFSVYFEYAGEDTSSNNNLFLGNTGLSAGLHFPLLTERLDLTVELSEWQNGWYVHDIYPDGLRHEGNVIGHWGADWRVPADGVGGASLMLRLGWRIRSGGFIETTLRSLDNESYTAPDYRRAYTAQARYSRAWRSVYLGAEIDIGRDVFDESFSRVAAFVRF